MRFLDKHSKKIFRILGIIGLLISIYFLAGGGIILSGNDTTKDSEGFYSTWTIQIKKDSSAIVIRPAGIDIDGGWDMGDLTTFKVEGSNNNPSSKIFVGAAREADIEAYLSSVEYDEITGLHILPSRASYQNHPGSIIPGNPSSQAFWAKSAYGAGKQNLTWEPEPDRHSLVLMNEDGSAGMDMNIVIGTKIPLLFIAGVGNLVVGVVVLLLSILMLSFSAKSRNIVFPEPLEHLRQQKMKSKTNN